jgi:hypothetical protein
MTKTTRTANPYAAQVAAFVARNATAGHVMADRINRQHDGTVANLLAAGFKAERQVAGSVGRVYRHAGLGLRVIPTRRLGSDEWNLREYATGRLIQWHELRSMLAA